jgi:hypothetical protein
VTTDYRTLSLLVHADAKVGKTSLAATAPLPILALDAEGGWKWVPGALTVLEMYGRPLRRRDWDPMREPPPRYDGTWEICVVTVRDWQTVAQVYAWVIQAPHDFKSLVVDSISEIQRRCKQNLVGSEAMKIQDWGVLLAQMDGTIRGFRDITLIPDNPIRVVVFIAETREKNGKYRPYMQGQIEVSLPYWMDVVGYLFTQQELDANGQPNGYLMRRMLVSPDPRYEAGERVQGRLPPVVDRPNVMTMLQAIYPEEVAVQ